MPDLLLDLSYDLYGRLCELAWENGVSAETLARQTFILPIGCNPSSEESPIFTGFLRRHKNDVLAIADREAVLSQGFGRAEVRFGFSGLRPATSDARHVRRLTPILGAVCPPCLAALPRGYLEKDETMTPAEARREHKTRHTHSLR